MRNTQLTAERITLNVDVTQQFQPLSLSTFLMYIS